MINGWNEWGNHVLAELKRIGDRVDMVAALNSTDHQDIRTLIGDSNVEIKALKVKAGIWGAFGGGISILLAIGMLLLSKLVGG